MGLFLSEDDDIKATVMLHLCPPKVLVQNTVEVYEENQNSIFVPWFFLSVQSADFCFLQVTYPINHSVLYQKAANTNGLGLLSLSVVAILFPRDANSK